MGTDVVVRALLGGLIVCVFSAAGELFKPKTLSGIFGAAPSVALVSLSMAWREHGASYSAVEARSMVVGAVALFCYAAACVGGIRSPRSPVWRTATLSWVVWLTVAGTIWVAAAWVAGASAAGIG